MDLIKKNNGELLSVVIRQVNELSTSDKKEVYKILSNQLKVMKSSSPLELEELEMFQEIFSKC